MLVNYWLACLETVDVRQPKANLPLSRETPLVTGIEPLVQNPKKSPFS
ncbi:hypothetical protein IQ238_15515 [Pleurocapsales cyanobacterium LEGE 06147]|nr:hypothetical protein [Pleurocapsales cyanobacterium LEGE 06147]